MPADDLVLFPAAALYLSRDVFSAGLRDALMSWAARPGLDRTALAHVYGDAQAPAAPDAGEEPLSPLPLNPAQREVVRAARDRPLTVVSGPPGCGKSHAVVAAAIEVVDRGGSVLIATQSPHAADVLGDLLRRYPGPAPVLFGDAERRAAIAADEALAGAAGQAVRRRATSAARWSREARRAAGGLATALRAGRDRRRELLAALPGPALVRALPLWIGTVTDVEDLLPPTPGLFALVILDEASHVDQIRAAAVLARARRALIVGDPRQLRFVSFVADVDVAGTLRRHGLDDRVDVRRVSAFDLAAGAAPVTWLAEHHRGDPHLIEFSAQRFYAGRINVLVTRARRRMVVPD
jgi:hypothetical protein